MGHFKCSFFFFNLHLSNYITPRQVRVDEFYISSIAQNQNQMNR